MRFTKHLFLVAVLSGSVLAGPACAGIPDSELAVLRDFYASTGGDHWLATEANVNKWFANDTDPCSWFGVGCEEGSSCSPSAWRICASAVRKRASSGGDSVITSLYLI